MRLQAPARQVRIRKLAKHTQQVVLREDQFESAEYRSLQNQYNVETGVEKSEEKEYHLQAALAADSRIDDKDAEKEIPAPPAQESTNIDYDNLYSLTFEKPATYIRFSQTVEDCTGCQYNMTTQDEVFLRSYNQRKTTQCSEDDFEKIMEIFGEVSDIQAPHSSVDGFVVSFDDMILSLRQQVDEQILIFAKDIYEHWKARKQDSNGLPLQPTLKFEKNQEKDDGDPYVCFRRRDARHTRKTRARDLQSTEKLKKLRKELEDGRALLDMAYRRELLKQDLLATERGVFEKRMKLKEIKIKLAIQGDDQDLVNERVGYQLVKMKPATDILQPQRRRDQVVQNQTGPTQSRVTSRSDNRPLEAEPVLLSDEQEKKENRLRAEIEEKIRLHRKWNEGHIDLTQEPLSPLHGQGSDTGFRTVTTQYQLMTPPSSVTFESFDHPSPSQELPDEHEKLTVRFSSPSEEESDRGHPAYRRRIGRGGRVWIDRRGMTSPIKFTDPILLDRWKYDREDDEQPIYDMDPYSTNPLKFRATIPLPAYLFPHRSRREDKNVQSTKETANGAEKPPRIKSPEQPSGGKPSIEGKSSK